MNPIDIIYCWQALLIAVAVSVSTQIVKAAIDIYRGHNDAAETPTLKAKLSVGKELRKQDRIINEILFPGIPLAFGIVYAIVIPARPDIIMTYVTDHHIDGWKAITLYAGWGGACGQFADYIFSKAKGAFDALIASKLSSLGVKTSTTTTLEVKTDDVQADAVVVTPSVENPVIVAPPEDSKGNEG